MVSTDIVYHNLLRAFLKTLILCVLDLITGSLQGRAFGRHVAPNYRRSGFIICKDQMADRGRLGDVRDHRYGTSVIARLIGENAVPYQVHGHLKTRLDSVSISRLQ